MDVYNGLDMTGDVTAGYRSAESVQRQVQCNI